MSKRKIVLPWIPDKGCVKIVGFDDCIIGLAEMYGVQDRLAYDMDLVLKKLMKEMDMSRLDAEDYFYYNIFCFVDETNPVFITRSEIIKEKKK
jgi:hypothetical protein